MDADHGASEDMQVSLENMVDEGGSFRILPSARSIIGAAGYATVVASMFLVVVCGTVESLGWNEGVPIVHPARLTGAATLLLTLLAGYFASDRFTALGYRQTNRIGTIASVVDLAIMASVEATFGLYPWVEAVTSAVFGVSIAFVLMSWGRLLREVPKNEILQTQASVFCIAGLLFIFAMLSTDAVKLFASLVYMALGCAAFFVFARDLGNMNPPDRKTSRERLRFDWRSSVSYAITGFAIGLACVILWWVMGSLTASIVFGAGFVVASVAALAISKAKGPSWVLLGPVERWTFPFIICTLLAIIVSGFAGVAGAVLGVVLYGFLMIRDISRTVTRQVLASEYDVQPVYLYTRATLPAFAGIAAGAALGTGLAALQEVQFVIWVLYALVGCFAIAAAIVPYGEDKLVMPTVEGERSDDSKVEPIEGDWNRACELVCTRCKLTPRESDVFGMLARGRTAKVIARDLTISEHTVKSHTYNVYRKLGINSQQELIDMVVAAMEEVREERSGGKERLAAAS